MNSQSILPASCTSSCLMLMIWSSRARNRSPDPVVSCFFGRIAPSDAATESCFSIRGNRENELQASKASDTETLQSQVNKAAKKRLSLSGLEILHGRLQWLVPTGRPCGFPRYFARIRSQLANYRAFPLQCQSEQLVSVANPGLK